MLSSLEVINHISNAIFDIDYICLSDDQVKIHDRITNDLFRKHHGEKLSLTELKLSVINIRLDQLKEMI